ncbi:MAG: hypothetical protein FWF02_11390, partial [Micrococcales bacterium]|nr:hypothetical protein [Micrococcales bacterium]
MSGSDEEDRPGTSGRQGTSVPGGQDGSQAVVPVGPQGSGGGVRGSRRGRVVVMALVVVVALGGLAGLYVAGRDAQGPSAAGLAWPAPVDLAPDFVDIPTLG